MIIDLKILNKYKEDGWLINQMHPKLPLIIWNYSPITQYTGEWNDILLMCRGLVTDNEGNIVARPFKKFFNIEENKHTPTTDFDVFDKMDGSLGILFNYKGEWILCTRGSFTSDQAIKGTELLKNYDTTVLFESYTYLFEIIYPENMIVVRYDEEMLMLLGAINSTTGVEADYGELYWFHVMCGYPIVKKHNGISDYKILKNIIKDNEEGFVVRFSNGDRCKIKGSEYIRLHRIMTNCSTTSIWEVLKNGDNIEDLLKDVPDEFYDKIKNYINDLNYQFYSIKEDARKRFNLLFESYNSELPIKKVYAEWVKSQPPHLHHILFKMFDNNDYQEYIWKIIRPEYKKL
jgi:T4 RnlA family RNA ligase